jgi:peptide-methionine (S)-S-oxide reductase
MPFQNLLKSKKNETATFGAGCFWGVEETFRKINGVTSTMVGYTGGTYPDPTYRDVCSGQTGHAEVVQVVYNPQEISYDALLKIFWECHNPMELNRQGPDVGTQYRSVIFYHTPKQKDAAVKSKTDLEKSKRFPRPIATQIVPAVTFYPAEDYHQQYLRKQGLDSCHY